MIGNELIGWHKRLENQERKENQIKFRKTFKLKLKEIENRDENQKEPELVQFNKSGVDVSF